MGKNVYFKNEKLNPLMERLAMTLFIQYHFEYIYMPKIGKKEPREEKYIGLEMLYLKIK